jgi:CheY-like chemotaxis protein
VTRVDSNHYDVVIVDDSDAEIALARECFRASTLASRWRSFTNGIDFLAHLRDVKAGTALMPALVLLDINMPEKNGFEVLREVRADPFFRTTPTVIMLTNSESLKDRERARTLGADAFRVKPSSVDEYVKLFDSLSSELRRTVPPR